LHCEQRVVVPYPPGNEEGVDEDPNRDREDDKPTNDDERQEQTKQHQEQLRDGGSDLAAIESVSSEPAEKNQSRYATTIDFLFASNIIIARASLLTPGCCSTGGLCVDP
jgi:hypothetical protein